ncbi:DnaJ domain-containing protein [bacterium]|nr:DnaJ domain-containing protein [bacterium]
MKRWALVLLLLCGLSLEAAVDLKVPGATFYEVIGVSEDATTEEIKAAYAAHANKFFNFQADAKLVENFKLLKFARDFLTDSERRVFYDSILFRVRESKLAFPDADIQRQYFSNFFGPAFRKKLTGKDLNQQFSAYWHATPIGALTPTENLIPVSEKILSAEEKEAEKAKAAAPASAGPKLAEHTAEPHKAAEVGKDCPSRISRIKPFRTLVAAAAAASLILVPGPISEPVQKVQSPAVTAPVASDIKLPKAPPATKESPSFARGKKAKSRLGL